MIFTSNIRIATLFLVLTAYNGSVFSQSYRSTYPKKYNPIDEPYNYTEFMETHSPFIAASVGPSITNRAGKTQTFYLQPDIEKKYTTDKNTSLFTSAEIFTGLQTRIKESNFLAQFGIALSGAFNAKLDGEVWEDANPDFINYNYSYKVSQLRIGIKSKLIADRENMAVQPYLSGTIGIGFNKADDFSITPKIYQEVPAPLFNSNTETSFSYSVGIGLQKTFQRDYHFGIGYEFSDLGKSSLARANGQTQNQGLQLDHLYTSQIVFSITYTSCHDCRDTGR